MADQLNQRKKLTILSTSFPRYAGDEAGIFVYRLVLALAELGYHGLVITPKDQADADYQIRNFKRISYRYKLFRKYGLAYGAGMFSNIKRHPDLLIQLPGLILSMLFSLVKNSDKDQLVIANWMNSGLVAYLYKIISGTSYLLVLRGRDSDLIKNRLLRFIAKKILLNAKNVICVNDSIAKMISKELPELADKVIQISNGVEYHKPDQKDLEQFCQERLLNTPSTKLLFIGTIIPVKDIATAIDALSILKDQDLLLILCGRTTDDQYLNLLKEKITAHKLSSKVRFEGAINPELIPHYLSISKYYLACSKYEGRPNSVLEALSAAKIVIASDIEAHKEIIIDKNNGLLFKSADAYSLANSISEIEKNGDLATKIANNAPNSTALRSWRECALEYDRLINKTNN